MTTALAAGTRAGDMEQERLWISLDIFPRILAVDLDIARKVTPSGSVKVLMLYEDNKERADEAMAYLKKRAPHISGLPMELQSGATADCEGYSAVMIVESISDALLKKAVTCAIENKIILFSPYEADVRKGVTASVQIQIKVAPYFNKATLAKSQIQIHKAALKYSQIYE